MAVLQLPTNLADYPFINTSVQSSSVDEYKQHNTPLIFGNREASRKGSEARAAKRFREASRQEGLGRSLDGAKPIDGTRRDRIHCIRSSFRRSFVLSPDGKACLWRREDLLLI